MYKHPTMQQAYDIGRTGARFDASKLEAARLMFEEYMRGHSWAVGPWISNNDTAKNYGPYYYEQRDRMMFALWRDCTYIHQKAVENATELSTS